MISAHSLRGDILYAEEGMAIGVLHGWSHCVQVRKETEMTSDSKTV